MMGSGSSKRSRRQGGDLPFGMGKAARAGGFLIRFFNRYASALHGRGGHRLRLGRRRIRFGRRRLRRVRLRRGTVGAKWR